MCFGGGSQPKAPKVVYTGPSEQDIERNKRELQQYQNQMTEQQNQFQAQLQAQIDRADQEYADLESQYNAQLTAAQDKASAAEQAALSAQGEADRATADAQGALDAAQEKAAGALNSAAAQGAMAQNNAYNVAVKQSEPVNAQETKAITDKKKPKSSLKISQNAVEAAAGTGLNIGV